MAEAAPRWATYADLEAVPDHLVAEIVEGRLETHTHTLPRLGAALAALTGELGAPFSRGRGGPGGWLFMPRTEFHFGRQVLVPDYAGWRRERLSVDPDAAFIETSPDWICEILSPATARLDRGRKRRIYAESGIRHLWLLDPWNGVLEGFVLTGGRWLLLDTVVRGGTVTLPPFDAVSFPLDDLFPFDDPAAPPPAET